MELRRARRRAGLISSSSNKLALLFCACVLLFSICALFSTLCSAQPCSVSKRSSSAIEYSYTQRAKSRRRLVAGGPGSNPPRCSAKCGSCTPCIPVHVPVSPGSPVMITEYYPEAWRCKCGNKLYMP